MSKRLLPLALPVCSFIWFTSTVVIAGHFYPGYRHTTQFISELGATGSPHGKYVNYLGFFPAELLVIGFVLVSYLVIPRTKLNITGLLFVAVYAMCLGVAAFSPCDFECKPDMPTLSHNVHMASAVPGYLSAIIAMFCIAIGAKSWTKSPVFEVAGFIAGALAILVFLNLDPSSTTIGLNQRMLELVIYAWLIFFGYSLSQYGFRSLKQ